MYKRLTTLLLTTLCIGMVVLGWRLFESQRSSVRPDQTPLQTLGFNLDLPTEGRVLQRDAGTYGVASMLLALGEDRLRVRVQGGMNIETARDHVREERQRLDLLFYDRQAPYPGQLSNTLRCPDRFQPSNLRDKGRAMSLVRLFANDRLAYGGCNADLLRFSATQAYFHDSRRERLILLEYFAVMETENIGPTVLRSFKLAER